MDVVNAACDRHMDTLSAKVEQLRRKHVTLQIRIGQLLDVIKRNGLVDEIYADEDECFE
jgi:hypothetical protein